jgi:hypothetical protein
MKQIAVKIAILIALFAAVPMSFAQPRGAGPIIQELRRVDQQAMLDYIDQNGFIVVSAVVQNVNVQALNNIAVVVDLTNVLRDAQIITDNQIVVGVNLLGEQAIITVYDL